MLDQKKRQGKVGVRWGLEMGKTWGNKFKWEGRSRQNGIGNDKQSPWVWGMEYTSDGSHTSTVSGKGLKGWVCGLAVCRFVKEVASRWLLFCLWSRRPFCLLTVGRGGEVSRTEGVLQGKPMRTAGQHQGWVWRITLSSSASSFTYSFILQIFIDNPLYQALFWTMKATTWEKRKGSRQTNK